MVQPHTPYVSVTSPRSKRYAFWRRRVESKRQKRKPLNLRVFFKTSFFLGVKIFFLVRENQDTEVYWLCRSFANKNIFSWRNRKTMVSLSREHDPNFPSQKQAQQWDLRHRRNRLNAKNRKKSTKISYKPNSKTSPVKLPAKMKRTIHMKFNIQLPG